MDEYLPPICSNVFLAMQNVDVKKLDTFSEAEIRPLLPCLVRMALCEPLDASSKWNDAKIEILKIMSGNSVVNDIVTLLSIDFNTLEQDLRKEQQIRQKQGLGGSSLSAKTDADSGVQTFERGDTNLKIRMLLREISIVQAEVQENKSHKVQSEILDVKVFLEEISDILCIVHAELPGVLKLLDLVEALLFFRYGAPLICRLVANNPESFQTVVHSLVTRGEKVDEDSVLGRARLEVVRALCAMNPREALNVRQLCVEKAAMPGVAVALSLQIAESQQEGEGEADGDIVAFISSLLLGTDQASRAWFANFIKGAQKQPRGADCLLERLRLNLLEQLYLLIPSPDSLMPERSVVRASALIRMYCAMKGMAALKYSDEEMKCLLNLATSKPPPTKSGAHFISLALCMLITSPNLLPLPDQELKVIEWIRWLMTNESSFEKYADKTTSFGEMLFLIALHFHNNQMHAIADLVCNTLGMKSAVKANALSRMRQIFTQELFTEQVIASHAVKIPVTPKLSSAMTGYLPIHSINQLLKSRVFSKHKVPIKDWIYQQICQSGVPLHPLMPQLIESYVSSIVVRGSTRLDYTNEPMTEAEVLDVFKDSAILSGHQQPGKAGSRAQPHSTQSKNLSPQLLILYYVLLYVDTWLNNIRGKDVSNRKVSPYSEVVLSQIPINFLIQEAQKEQPLYPGLFAPLLRLLATHYPHLCQVEDWLEETLLASKSDTPSLAPLCPPETSSLTPDSLQESLRKLGSCPARVVQQLEGLLSLEVLALLPFRAVMVGSLTQLLQEGVPRRVVELVCRLWFRLHSISPRLLRLETVNALQGSNVTEPYSEEQVALEPTIVLRCDRRVFRCPPLLEIMLRILAAYTQASRVLLSTHLALQQQSAGDPGDKDRPTPLQQEQLRSALVCTQESLILQILLEACLPFAEDKEEGSSSSNLREVRCLIFSYVHKAFIADTNLAKLVHFQGYASELIPLVVAGVPSMHICMDYIPELLGQPDIEKQTFGIQLLAELSLWYALQKPLSLAQLSVNLIFTMLTVHDDETRVGFLTETLPCLVKFCRAFPPLCRDAVDLLEQAGRICHSKLALDSNICPGDALKAETKGGEENSWMKKPSKVDIRSRYQKLHAVVLDTFSQLTSQSILTHNLF